jgi:hypothetical protein
LSVDGQMYELYINAFRACNHLYTYPQDFYTDLEAESKDLDNESNGDPQEQANEHPLADFKAFARRRP